MYGIQLLFRGSPIYLMVLTSLAFVVAS